MTETESPYAPPATTAIRTPPAVWWVARLCGLWLIALGVWVLIAARRDGVELGVMLLVLLGGTTGLPGAALALMPHASLRRVIGVLSAILGITLPLMLVLQGQEPRVRWLWLAYLAPWLVLVWTRYRYMRDRITNEAE